MHLGWAESYQATMASQAASTVVTAGGAGGIAILFLVLVRGGLDRAQAAARIVAFLTYHYAIYLAALVVFGSLLWLGVFAGSHPAALTILPAALSGAAVVVVLIAARPSRLERPLSTLSRREGRLARHRRRWRSTNLLERSLEEVRRRTKVIGRFPGETSCLSLCWAVLDLVVTHSNGANLQPA